MPDSHSAISTGVLIGLIGLIVLGGVGTVAGAPSNGTVVHTPAHAKNQTGSNSPNISNGTSTSTSAPSGANVSSALGTGPQVRGPAKKSVKSGRNHNKKKGKKNGKKSKNGKKGKNGKNGKKNATGKGQSVKLRKCPGVFSPIKSATCHAENMMLGGFVGGIVHFVRGVITGIVNLIVGTPVPKHNGQPALFQSPTNQPWKAIHHSWTTFALPLGLAEWMLMVLGVLFSQVYISNPAQELKRRELWHRSWKVLFGVLASWAIGSAILWLANAVTLTVAPNGDAVAKTLSGFLGNIAALGFSGLLLWFFDGILFLFLLMLVVAKIAVVFSLMWGLPILLPLAAFDVGPLKILSSPARGMIDMFIPFVFLTLPTALVLRVGYIVVNGLNKAPAGHPLIAKAGTLPMGVNGLIITGFWIIATIAPLFVFQHAGAIRGLAAGALGAATINGIDNLGEKVQDAKDRVKSSGSSSGETPPNATESTDITDGSPIHRANDGTLGGPLVSGRKQRLALESGNSLPTTAEQEATSLDAASVAPLNPDTSAPSSTAPTTADVQDPELPPGQPLPGGESGGEAGTASGAAGAGAQRTTASESGTTGNETSGEPITPENVNRVYTRDELPTGTKYDFGYEKDGEFKSITHGSHPGFSRTEVGRKFRRLNKAHGDKTLLLQSKENGSYYDPSGLRYEKTQEEIDQMRRDCANDVMNS